jgi:glycosyltransferase involved in cell wall biosynthesis
MSGVSVVIVTKDEEGNIEDALRSAAEFQEIVVVDSFSSDRTVEICRRYTDRVYQHEWQGYSKQKQLAVDYASNEWVFLLDADERITHELGREVFGSVQSSSSAHDGYDGFFVPRKNYFLGKWIRHSGWWPDCTLRLFRKSAGRLEDREVHEKVVVRGKTGLLNNPMEHYTYRTIGDFLRKMDAYSALAAREIRKKGRPGISAIMLKPFFTSFKMYLLRLGFLDGMHGMLLAVLYGYYTFLKYTRAWEGE